MSTMSGGITIQGLGSGTDFGAMIEKLKKYESIPKLRMEIWRSEWTARVNAFNTIMETMAEAKAALASFSNINNMMARAVSSSKAEVATATGGADAEEGIYSINVQQMATTAMFSSKKVFSSPSEEVNTSGSYEIFSYTYKGVTRQITVANNSSIEQLVSKINGDSSNPGVRASLVRNGTGYVFQLQGKDTGSAASLSIDSSLPGLSGTPVFGSEFDTLNTSGVTKYFEIAFGGSPFTVQVDPGDTWDAFMTKFNSEPGATTNNVGVRTKSIGSGLQLEFFNTNDSSVVTPTFVDSDGIDGLNPSTDSYFVNQSQDAIFSLNGWSMEYTSTTNTLTEVIPGLNITLKSTGETTLTVANDKEKLKENIYEVVDTINTLLSTIKALTKFDADKQSGAPESDDSTGLLKMTSQFNWQKGSILTGNYGVMLLRTRLSDITASRGIGFSPKTSLTDPLNDMYLSLAQIGIATQTRESETDFGLLVIDEDKLNAALDKDFRGVADLFSANKQASTDSSDFWVASIASKPKAGIYDVKYDVINSPPGDITNVTIGGYAAVEDSAFPGRWTVADYNSPIAGLAIQFDGADKPDGSYSNKIQIKDGKITELCDMLSQELEPVIEGQKGKAGAIPLLINNYQEIIKNIDAKISREVTRLAQWERREKAKYARLDTLLARYNNQMEQNSAALAQVSNNKQ